MNGLPIHALLLVSRTCNTEGYLTPFGSALQREPINSELLSWGLIKQYIFWVTEGFRADTWDMLMTIVGERRNVSLADADVLRRCVLEMESDKKHEGEGQNNEHAWFSNAAHGLVR